METQITRKDPVGRYNEESQGRGQNSNENQPWRVTSSIGLRELFSSLLRPVSALRFLAVRASHALEKAL